MTPPPEFPPPPGSLQSLPPEQARFCLSVARFVSKELGVGLARTALLIGFSGGADSTALLLCFHYLAPKLGCALLAAHLDHGLRPTSEQEAAWCRAFCAKLGIPCISADQDVASLQQELRCGVEDAGRKARYAFFTEAARQHGCDWIITGHNKNDLGEDILMRLVRGSGWPGLSGMAAVDPERKILRPLLLTSRTSIENFLKALGVHWLTDESNKDTGYFRNRVRHTLLPLLLEENPHFLDVAVGLWRLGSIDREYFASLLSQPHAETQEELFSPSDKKEDRAEHDPAIAPAPHFFSARESVLSLPKALRLRLYKKILDSLGPGQARLDGLLALDTSFLRKAGNTKHQFSGRKLVCINSKGISWKRQ